MDALMVTGDQIELTPDPPWKWMVPPVKVPVMGAHRITSEGKSVIWETDIIAAGPLATGQLYSAPGFDVPGTVLSVVLNVTPGTMSEAVKDTNLEVATIATTGTFTAAVIPAINPSTGVPDPLITKTGTWAVVSQEQSASTSGKPKAKNQDGKSGAATSKGAGKSLDVHFVAVEIEDHEGNKLGGQQVVIVSPDGIRNDRKLTAAGAARVDGIRVEGEATVHMLRFDRLQAATRSGKAADWIAFDVVDEEGQPLAGALVEVTTPDGEVIVAKTGPKGAVRIDGLKQVGDCDVKVTLAPASVAADGGASADEPRFVVDDGQGTTVVVGDGPPTVVENPKEVSFVEVEDALFRTESCVVMPEGQLPGAEHEGLTSVGLFAGVLRISQERAGSKLFVAGHADTVGTEAFNLPLSQERAKCVLAALQGPEAGGRDAFVALAHARHRVSDYKQWLSWCVHGLSLGFTCDAGPIDDKAFSGIAPLRVFQAEYNQRREALGVPKAAEIAVDGSIGKQTWGALYDVMQFGIAEELGETIDELRKMQSALLWVDDARKSLGFGEHHPIEALGKDNFLSQNNRRVEVLFFDKTDNLPDLAAAESDPATSDLYVPPDGFVRTPIDLVSAKRWVAEWADETARFERPATMSVNAPGCPAGVPMKFTISIAGFEELDTVEGTSADGRIEETFSAWDVPEEPPFAGLMGPKDEFPTLFFEFVVEGGGRRTTSRNKIPYSAEIQMVLQVAEEGEDDIPVANQPYVLATMFGKRTGRTDAEGRVVERGLPPGGIHLVLRDTLLIDVDVLPHGWDGETL
ncbi:MAG: hypothetical protein RJA70_1095 [Pseudomonadota bacterium]|jgi:flagellar motor protein MotB